MGSRPDERSPRFRLLRPRGRPDFSVLALVCSGLRCHSCGMLAWCGDHGCGPHHGKLGAPLGSLHTHGPAHGCGGKKGQGAPPVGGVGPGLGWTSPSMVRSLAGLSSIVGELEEAAGGAWSTSIECDSLGWSSGPLGPPWPSSPREGPLEEPAPLAHACISSRNVGLTSHWAWKRSSSLQVSQMAFLSARLLPQALNDLYASSHSWGHLLMWTFDLLRGHLRDRVPWLDPSCEGLVAKDPSSTSVRLACHSIAGAPWQGGGFEHVESLGGGALGVLGSLPPVSTSISCHVRARVPWLAGWCGAEVGGGTCMGACSTLQVITLVRPRFTVPMLSH